MKSKKSRARATRKGKAAPARVAASRDEKRLQDLHREMEDLKYALATRKSLGTVLCDMNAVDSTTTRLDRVELVDPFEELAIDEPAEPAEQPSVPSVVALAWLVARPTPEHEQQALEALGAEARHAGSSVRAVDGRAAALRALAALQHARQHSEGDRAIATRLEVARMLLLEASALAGGLSSGADAGARLQRATRELAEQTARLASTLEAAETEAERARRLRARVMHIVHVAGACARDGSTVESCIPEDSTETGRGTCTCEPVCAVHQALEGLRALEPSFCQRLLEDEGLHRIASAVKDARRGVIAGERMTDLLYAAGLETNGTALHALWQRERQK